MLNESINNLSIVLTFVLQYFLVLIKKYWVKNLILKISNVKYTKRNIETVNTKNIKDNVIYFRCHGNLIMNPMWWYVVMFQNMIRDLLVSVGTKYLILWNLRLEDTLLLYFQMHLSFICRTRQVSTSRNFGDLLNIEG